MGLMDNFKRNVGGWGGALMAGGDALGVIAQSLANARPGETAGMAFGRGLGASQPALRQGFNRGRERVEDDEFRAYAAGMAKTATGKRERQLWTSAAAGKSGDRMAKLLPALWAAQAHDARTAARASNDGMNFSRHRENQMIEAARQYSYTFSEGTPNEAILGELGVANLSGVITTARKAKWGESPGETQSHYDRVSNSALGKLIKGLKGGGGGDQPGPPEDDGPGFGESLMTLGTGAKDFLQGLWDGDDAVMETPDSDLRGLMSVTGGSSELPDVPSAAPNTPGKEYGQLPGLIGDSAQRAYGLAGDWAGDVVSGFKMPTRDPKARQNKLKALRKQLSDNAELNPTMPPGLMNIYKQDLLNPAQNMFDSLGGRRRNMMGELY